MQHLTYISINVQSINQFHSKTAELLSEKKTLTQNFNLILWTLPARHTDQRQSMSQNFSLKNLAKNHAEHLQTSHDYQYIKYS